MKDVKYELKIEHLRQNLPFWDRLRETQREAIASNSRSVRYKKNSIIAGIGEDCGVIIVRRGRICAATVSEDGREVALLCSRSGEICLLAAHTILNTVSFNVSICAETEADLILINSQIYAEICKSSLPADSFTRRLISEHFVRVVGDMQNMLTQSPERRIAAFLCDCSDRIGGNRVRTTHEQIAKHVGTAREVVSRTLKRLKSEGIIQPERGAVVILDKARLRNLI